MKRFGLIDLSVAAVCVAFIVTTTMVARQNAQSAQDIAGCASHLKQVFGAITTYRTDFGNFPRTRYTPAAPIAAYTGVSAPSPFAADGPAINDVTAAVFLLVRAYGLGPDVFNCPAALRNGLAEKDDFDPRSSGNRSNFKSRLNYNYSIANMYPSQSVVENGYDLMKIDADFALGSDTNPGHESASSATMQMTVNEARMGNSPNHQRDGQNVLFGDGSVSFRGTPFVRDEGDHIFASSGVFPEPASASDSVLLPVWADGPAGTPSALVLRRWVFAGAMVLSTGMLALIVIRGLRNTRRERARA